MATNFTRKNLKEFSANNKSGLQVFGSRASNSPSNSSDPEILQSNPNFELGWRGATLLNPDNSTRLPQIDEMAALDYIHNYALNYILQKGIPEYNAATSYFISDLARDAGGTEIYKSITDDNLGNALNDTANWEFQGDLSLLKNVPSNTIIVNSEADLPPAVGSVITFGAAENGKTYMLNETLVYDKEFVVEDGIDVKFTSVNLNKAWVYIGTGTMLTSSDFNIIDIESTIFLAPAGQKFNTSGTGTLIITKSFLAGANIGGTLNNSFTTMNFVDFSDYGQGFTVGADFAFSINSASSAFWRNEIATMFTFSSPTTEIVLTNFGFTPDANETALDFDQSLRTTDATIIMAQCPFDLSLGGVALAANGLDQKYAGSSFQNNEGLANSTVSLKITFEGNSSPTTITVAGQNEPISLNTTYAIDNY
jgi:hypothetical protein